MTFNLNFKTATYREIAEDLDRAVSWLASLGFRVGPTRVGRYRTDLRRFVGALEARTLESLLTSEGTGDLINTLFECTELRLIHQVLAPGASPELIARLGPFIKGPAAYRDERSGASSNRARNVGFELSLGAQLLNAGLPVEFHPDGDLRFEYGDCEFFVECKRPQVYQQVHSRIKGALSQLEARYKDASDPSRARGLVAVSATKVLNPRGNYYRTASRATLDAGLGQAVNKFIGDYGSRWQRPSDGRTLGCVVELRAFVVVESEDTPTTGGCLAMTDRLGLDPVSRNLMASLSEQFPRCARP